MNALILYALVAATPATTSAAAESEATALLEAWLSAQNAGDFAAYEKLYAANFTGTKRVDNKSSKFGRTRWMADRRKMFKVETEGIHLTVRTASVTIGFTQT